MSAEKTRLTARETLAERTPGRFRRTPHMVIESEHSAELRQGPRRETLAFIYQEILTVVTRLRTNRHTVKDAAAFRASMKSAFAAADAEATRKGYSPEDIRLATFAVVAFLDESVVNANKPNFAEWIRLPLQEEMLGVRTSGEIFFQVIDRLMARSDAAPDAEVLEVFGICLLLGYRGRFAGKGEEAVRPIVKSLAEKVQRIRGAIRLAPDGAPVPDAVLRPPQDPWVRALILGTLGAVFLAGMFFVGFKIALVTGASGIHSFSMLATH